MTALLSLIATAIGIAACQGKSNQQNISPANPIISVTTETVSLTNTSITFDAVGTVSSQFVTELSSRVQERVTSVKVKEGDLVRAGDTLINFDSRDLTAANAQANADLQASTAQFNSASTTARIASQTTQDQVRTVEAQVLAAQAALESAVAKKNLVDAGPRLQERAQAADDVARANASLVLAQKTYDRMSKLYSEDAITGEQLDTSKSELDAAQAAYQSTLQQQSMSNEGSRAEDKAAAQAQVMQAQASLTAARSMLAQSLAEAQIVSVRQDDVEAAHARIAQAEAAATIARSNLSYATIVAPYDGVIAERDADPGLMAGPGVPLLKIQGGGLRLDLSVPESDVSHFFVGSSVPVTIDALGTKRYSARIVSISPQGDPSSHTFLIKALLPQIPGTREGMFGRASIRSGAANAMTISTSCVVNREGLTYVYVIDNRAAQLRLVSLGQETGSTVAVLSGLQIGDKVAASNVAELTDNISVSEAKQDK
jgi:RND family efflux transporter MFP subunit